MNKGNCIIGVAFLISSLLFSFVHFNFEGENLYIQITYLRTYLDFGYFGVGILYAWVYYKYGYILTTILAQILSNTIGTAYTLYMYASDCYDGCVILDMAFSLPLFGFNFIVVIILLVRCIIKCCSKKN